MKSFQKRLLELEESSRERNELFIAIFWVRLGYEEEDIERQKMELKQFYKDLPKESFHQTFILDSNGMSYDDFMQYIRKQLTTEEWWKKQVIRGIPCNDYREGLKKLKKI